MKKKNNKVSKKTNKQVVVVLSIYQKKFTEDEKISLKQLRKQLYKKYEICLYTHKDMLKYIKKEPLLQGYKIKIFPKKFFTYQGFNKLLKSQKFYTSFKDYKYMLVIHTDCLIFKNDLSYFCEKNYDYIGAPIFNDYSSEKLIYHFVGNGGLSLRKISTAIKVLESRKNPIKFLKWSIPHFLKLPKKLFNKFILKNEYPISSLLSRNEDIFWSCEAKKFYPQFKVAPFKEACKFSIENGREKCMEINSGELPFGCHAFHHHKDFWRKHSNIKM